MTIFPSSCGVTLSFSQKSAKTIKLSDGAENRELQRCCNEVVPSLNGCTTPIFNHGGSGSLTLDDIAKAQA